METYGFHTLSIADEAFSGMTLLVIRPVKLILYSYIVH